MYQVAALFVDLAGPYRLPFVDLWTEERDARGYSGCLPVVAHPPCARWGRMAVQIALRPGQPRPGDDGGCFDAALTAARHWGGVVEHPEGSRAFPAFGLSSPAKTGEWSPASTQAGEWTAYADQSAYGHVAQKPTWLLFCGLRRPAPLLTGGAPTRFVESLSSSDPRRWLTPLPFALLLLSLALSSRLPASGPTLTPYRRRRRSHE